MIPLRALDAQADLGASSLAAWAGLPLSEHFYGSIVRRGLEDPLAST
jgi:hypothetical protein